ncbi:MAG: YwqG family protein, partial [Bacteroidota bacterium]
SLLYFLAQLNLGLFPSIGSFPEQGCLQFFAGAKKEDAMVRYWADISQDTSDWSVPEHATLANGPLNNEQAYSLDYTLVRELMPHSDYRFKEHIGTQLKLGLEEEYWSMLKAYAALHNGSGHKLGGFAYFPQDDPRYAWAEEKELLFQLDSDPSIQCDWGALGSGAFFISEAALGQANFSEVEFIQTRI